MLEHHPHHVRRKIALILTLSIAVILIAVLALRFSRPSGAEDANMGTKFKVLYSSILNSKPSTLDEK